MSKADFEIRVRPDRQAYSYDDALAYLLVEAAPQFDSVFVDSNKIPVEIVVVLDISGSMDAPEKYPRLLLALQQMIENLDASDRLSIVVFSHVSDLIAPLTDGDSLRNLRLSVVKALERSPIKFGGGTKMAPALLRAFDELDGHARRDSVRRVYCLTDGLLHDIESCKKVLVSAPLADTQLHVYGFGSDFDVNQLLDLLGQRPGSVVKPLIDTNQIVWTFGHLASTARDVVARELNLDVNLSDGVVAGDAFCFRPLEVHLGRMAANRHSAFIGAVENRRTYSFLLEVRLPLATDAGLTKLGAVTFRYLRGPQNEPCAQSVDLTVKRQAKDGDQDARVNMVRDVLVGIRDESPAAQVARFRARIALYREERRDPKLITALEHHLDALLHPEKAPPPTETDRKYARASPVSEQMIASRATIAGARILICHEDASVLLLVQHALEARGAMTQLAANAHDAILAAGGLDGVIVGDSFFGDRLSESLRAIAQKNREIAIVVVSDSRNLLRLRPHLPRTTFVRPSELPDIAEIVQHLLLT